MPHVLSHILASLQSATITGRASWKESGRAGELVLPLPESGIVVTLSKNPFTELFGNGPAGPFKLSVLSESGTEVASLEARHGEEHYSQLKDLFESAYARARRVVDVLNDVERQLALL